MKHSPRFYRNIEDTLRWNSFRTTVESTDLFLRATCDLSTKAEELVRRYRSEIKRHIELQNSFLTSFSPVDKLEGCAEIIASMYRASEAAGTGPMAAVAGAIAEFVGKELAPVSDEIIIENGGDLWLLIKEPVQINIYTESVYFKNDITLRVNPEDTPCGICTSSGKIGHSFSYGKADSVTVLSADAAFADAAATATANLVKTEESVEKALSFCMAMEQTRGAVIIYRDIIALQGSVELIES